MITDFHQASHLTDDFPVLSASVTPLIPKDNWELTVTSETGIR